MSDQPANSTEHDAAAPTADTPPPPPAAAPSTSTAVADATVAMAQPSGRSGVPISLHPAQIASVAGAVLVIVGLLVSSPKLWDTMSWMWAVTGIAAAVLTITPLVGSALNLSAGQMRSVTLGAAVALGAWWALFILARLETTGGFLVTVGAAAAIAGAVNATKATSVAGTDG